MPRDPVTIAEAVRRLTDFDPVEWVFQPQRGETGYKGKSDRQAVLKFLTTMDGHIENAGPNAQKLGLGICVPVFWGEFGGMGTVFFPAACDSNGGNGQP